MLAALDKEDFIFPGQALLIFHMAQANINRECKQKNPLIMARQIALRGAKQCSHHYC